MVSILCNSNNLMGVSINTNPLLQIKTPHRKEDKDPPSHIASKKKSYDLDPRVSVYKSHAIFLLSLIQDKLSFFFHKRFSINYC